MTMAGADASPLRVMPPDRPRRTTTRSRTTATFCGFAPVSAVTSGWRHEDSDGDAMEGNCHGGPDCRYRVGHELSDLPVATRGRALRWWAARAFVSDVLEGCVDESRDPAP